MVRITTVDYRVAKCNSAVQHMEKRQVGGSIVGHENFTEEFSFVKAEMRNQRNKCAWTTHTIHNAYKSRSEFVTLWSKAFLTEDNCHIKSQIYLIYSIAFIHQFLSS